MRIRYIDFYKIMIYILVFLNLGFLDFLVNYNLKIQLLTAIIAVMVTIVYLTQPKKTHIYDKWPVIYIGMLLFLIVVEISRINIYSSVSITSAINLVRNYTFVLYFFPLYEILASDREIKNDFIRKIAILGFCALVIRFFGWFIYNYLGYNLFPGYFDAMGYDWVRNGNVRIGGTFLDGFVFVYLSLKVLKNRKLKYILGIAFLLGYSYFVYGSRTQLLCYVCVFAILYVVKGEEILKGFLNLVIIIVGLGIIFYTTPTIQNFFASFSVDDKMYGIGTLVRVNGQKLYQQQWLEASRLWGFGITEDGNYIGLVRYYLSDLGILRNLYQYGVIGFIICIIPFINGIIRAILGVFNKAKDSEFLLGIVVYTIITSIASQNVYDYSRIMILPFLLAFISLVAKEDRLQGE